MLEEECRKDEPQDMVLQPPMPQLQQQMHQMQGIQTSPTMQQTIGGAPIADMGMMPGSVPGRPANMMGPGISNETIDEVKQEM